MSTHFCCTAAPGGSSLILSHAEQQLVVSVASSALPRFVLVLLRISGWQGNLAHWMMSGKSVHAYHRTRSSADDVEGLDVVRLCYPDNVLNLRTIA